MGGLTHTASLTHTRTFFVRVTTSPTVSPAVSSYTCAQRRRRRQHRAQAHAGALGVRTGAVWSVRGAFTLPGLLMGWLLAAAQRALHGPWAGVVTRRPPAQRDTHEHGWAPWCGAPRTRAPSDVVAPPPPPAAGTACSPVLLLPPAASTYTPHPTWMVAVSPPCAAVCPHRPHTPRHT